MLVAPAKTPKDVVDKLNATTNEILDTPDVTRQLLNLGTDFNWQRKTGRAEGLYQSPRPHDGKRSSLMQDLPDRNNETAIAFLATRLVSTLFHRLAVVLAPSTPCFRSRIPRRRNGAAAPRADLQYRSSGSALKDQWDPRRVNQFGGNFTRARVAPPGGPSRTGRRCGDVLFSKFILANCGSADDDAGAAAAQRATGPRLIDPRRPIAPNGSTPCFRSENSPSAEWRGRAARRLPTCLRRSRRWSPQDGGPEGGGCSL